jgi:hypothetical protein
MTFYTFANATTAIPLSNLDANFATPITLGNTAVTINGTFSSIGNLTLNNANIASLSTPITIAQGGTGLSSTPTAGQIDIGNGTGFTRSTLTAGSNITITNGNGTVTIASTGSGSSNISNGTSNVSIASANGAITMATAGTTAITVDTSQNVGIGNASSNVNDQVGGVRPLLVSKSDTNTTIAGSLADIVVGNSDTTTSNTSQLSFAAITGANTTYYTSAAINCIFGARTNGQYPAGILTFSTSTSTNSAPTEKMRLDNSGNLLVGTTGSNFTGAKLSVTNSGGSNQGALGLINSNSSSKSWTFGPDTNGNMVCMTGSAAGAYINYGSNGWSATSDERLKDITGVIENGIEKICVLRPVIYTWKFDAKKISQVGLIAQDVQKVLPQAVSEGSDGYLGVRYTEVVPLLVAAIQELKAEFDAYKAAHA